MNKLLCFFLIMVSAVSIRAGEYVVNRDKPNLVKFVSDAPIEDFEGVTDRIDGYIFWEGDNLLENSEIYFEVDLNAVDTGIGLRNRHMRENYLHTDKYPFTHFKGQLVKAIKLNEDEYQVRVSGKMFIHGVEKDIEVPGTIAKAGEDGYHIKCEFQILLSDYNIEIPSIMFYKIDETMDLQLDFYVTKTQETE